MNFEFNILFFSIPYSSLSEKKYTNQIYKSYILTFAASSFFFLFTMFSHLFTTFIYGFWIGNSFTLCKGILQISLEHEIPTCDYYLVVVMWEVYDFVDLSSYYSTYICNNICLNFFYFGAAGVEVASVTDVELLTHITPITARSVRDQNERTVLHSVILIMRLSTT